MPQYLKHQRSLAHKRESKKRKREPSVVLEPEDFTTLCTGVQGAGAPLSGDGDGIYTYVFMPFKMMTYMSLILWDWQIPSTSKFGNHANYVKQGNVY